MKTIKIIIIHSILLTSLVCCKNPLDGFVVGFKEPIDKSTVRIQFSLPENGRLPNDLKFSITGKDADKIVTNLNSKNFKISKEGIIILAVNPEIIPSNTNPIKITLVAESSNYTKLIKDIVFTGPNNFNIYFGFIKRNTSGNINSNQLVFDPAKSSKIDVNSFTNPENISINFPNDINLLSSDNEKLTGIFDVTLHHYDSKNSKGYLPTGGLAAYPLDKNNNPLPNPFDFIQTAGLISLEMSTQNHKIVKKFSKPLSISLTINNSIINPLTNKPISESDILTVFSYDSETGIWREEDEVKVEKSNVSNRFEVVFKVSHLTYWVLGWKRNLCKVGPKFTIRSDYNDLDIVYYGQLVNTANNQLIKDYFISLNNNSAFTLSLLPSLESKVKFKLYDYNNYYGGDKSKVIFESPELPICTETNSLINASKLINPKYLELDIKVTCPDGKVLNEAGLPAQMRIQCSETGKNSWRDIGTLTRYNRKIKTYRVEIGKRYDLRGSTDGGVSWPYVQKNYLIDKQAWGFDLPGKEYCK